MIRRILRTLLHVLWVLFCYKIINSLFTQINDRRMCTFVCMYVCMYVQYVWPHVSYMHIYVMCTYKASSALHFDSTQCSSFQKVSHTNLWALNSLNSSFLVFISHSSAMPAWGSSFLHHTVILFLTQTSKHFYYTVRLP